MGGKVDKVVTGVASWSEAALAILGLVSMAWLGMKRLYKMARNIEKLIEMTESSSVRLAAVEKEVRTNGGSSLKDAIHRVEKNQSLMAERLSRLEVR